MYSVTMVGTKEPIARADEHNRHPNIVEVRIPNLFRRPPEAGLVKHITLTTMDVNHAETQKNYVNFDGKVFPSRNNNNNENISSTSTVVRALNPPPMWRGFESEVKPCVGRVCCWLFSFNLGQNKIEQ